MNFHDQSFCSAMVLDIAFRKFFQPDEVIISFFLEKTVVARFELIVI